VTLSRAAVPNPVDLRSLVLNLKVVVLVITILAAVVAVAISLYIVRPLERMIGEMVEMAGENNTPLADSRTNDEIDRLAQLYNQTFQRPGRAPAWDRSPPIHGPPLRRIVSGWQPKWGDSRTDPRCAPAWPGTNAGHSGFDSKRTRCLRPGDGLARHRQEK
jgi:hypothetical protein